MKQQGFTLIELMIVVAIIGILAAIALPQYQNFMARSQASESVVLLDGAKTTAEDFATFNGVFVSGTSAATGNVTLSALGARVVGSYGNVTTTTEDSNGAGSITYTFNSTGVNNNIKGKTVTYTRTADGDWSCASNLSAAFAPKGCTSS
ncbi:hypothetical protein TI05_01925 [Achromatium sp. WMS3]|nr:hypothetical protein TI05_01925 [Achromatium sp. WMS3]